MNMEWISVKDQMPEQFRPVIVYRDGNKVEQGYWDGTGYWKGYATWTKHVTHWMPMPEPPKGEEK